MKLQYFGHLMQRADSLEKTLMLGKIKGRRRRGQQRMRWLDGITDSTDMSLSETPGDSDGQGAWCAVVHGVAKSQTQFSYWGTTMRTQDMGLQRVRHNLATEEQQWELKITLLTFQLFIACSVFIVFIMLYVISIVLVTGSLYLLIELFWYVSGKESTCQAGDMVQFGFDPWVGKIPWRRKWQPTAISSPGQSHRQRSLMGYSTWSRQRVGHNFGLPS